MPSTVAHALVTFGTGLVLHTLSNKRFTALHIFLLTLHSTNGPDIGSVVEFLLQGFYPRLGTWFMQIVHTPIGYPLTLGLLWTFLGIWMSKKDLVWWGGWCPIRVLPRSYAWNTVQERVGGKTYAGGEPSVDTETLLNSEDTDELGRSRDRRYVRDLSTAFDEQDLDRHFTDATPPPTPPLPRATTIASSPESTRLKQMDNNLDMESISRRRHAIFAWSSLTFRTSWALAWAGGLLHFRMDTLYEDNGNDPLYRWIISTGYWEPGANDVIEPSVVLAFLCALGGLLFTFALLYTSLRDTVPLPQFARLYLWKIAQRPHGTARVMGFVTGGITVAYALFVWSRVRRDPRIPAVGEEADLGVLVFESITGILPLLFCLGSMPSQPLPDGGEEVWSVPRPSSASPSSYLASKSDKVQMADDARRRQALVDEELGLGMQDMLSAFDTRGGARPVDAVGLSKQSV
ncbi:hypothetical protein DFS34DRAFT_481298 [Phlyctochytrium arcticum]|nr:hypothetical protein DFS34DRAFT_481298 [Phlyctochytrium arcticum]